MQKEKLITFTQNLRSNLYQRIISNVDSRIYSNYRKAGIAFFLTVIFAAAFNNEHPSLYEQISNMAAMILMCTSMVKGILYSYDALQYKSFKNKLFQSWFISGKDDPVFLMPKLWGLVFSLKESFYFPNACEQLSKEEVQELFSLPLEEYDIVVLNDAIQSKGYIHYDDIMKLHFVSSEEYNENIQAKINTFIEDNNLVPQQHNVSLLFKTLLPARIKKYMNGSR